MATYGFDGVDIALEFADADVPEDRAALTTFLEVCENILSRLMRKEPCLLIGNCQAKTVDVTFNCYIDRGSFRRKSFEGV